MTVQCKAARPVLRSAYLARVGTVMVFASFLLRYGAAVYMVRSIGSTALVAAGAICYLAGKGLFYLGLFLAGPAILQRYPWLNPVWWRNRFRSRRQSQTV